jgi:hypothetical protein
LEFCNVIADPDYFELRAVLHIASFR